MFPFDDGFAWIADPEEMIQRASLAVDLGTGLHAVEPVDHPLLDGWLADEGGLDGVIVLMDRHTRDADAIAARQDVPIYVPDGFGHTAAKLGRDVRPLGDALAGGPYEALELAGWRLWEEAALWSLPDRTLIVPESLGTIDYFLVGEERIGVHPTARLWPPRGALADVDPRRMCVGHGPPVDDLETGELARSLATARRGIPRAWLRGAITTLTHG